MVAKHFASFFQTVAKAVRDKGPQLGGVALAAGLVSCGAVLASSDGVHPATYPWNHSGIFSAMDHASMRRGYQVYREVCSACHSMKYVAFRHLVNQTHSVKEVKALAEEVEVEDGPNENGEMYTRPGKLFDYHPQPYPNAKAAMAANNGAAPPDLSLIVRARHGAENYVFALLNGYVDPPAGVKVAEGGNYNPYFPGGIISMARPLYDGQVEYPDGTPATTSQMAKDVATFLTWASTPEMDEKKLLSMRIYTVVFIMTVASVYYNRHKWSSIKTRHLAYAQWSQIAATQDIATNPLAYLIIGF